MQKTILILVVASGWTGNHADAAAPEIDVDARFRQLPPGWKVTRSVTAFQRTIGGEDARIANTHFSIDGEALQINTVDCESEQAAVRVREGILQVHRGVPEFCPREGSRVFEFVAKDMRLVERAYRELNLKPPRMTYDVSFRAAPIVSVDYMFWNRMYNAFLTAEPDEHEISELAKKFKFGDRIRVRNHGLGRQKSLFTFTPAAAKSVAEAQGEITSHSFSGMPRIHDIPQVEIVAAVTAEAFTTTPGRPTSRPELLAATEFWPVSDAEVIALAGEITAGQSDPSGKVGALLAWFNSRKNVRFDGPVTGSRYGVKVVLKQGFGHCWDFSDCFVTLCRAAGVPSRQVYGWLYGQSGHVWAEVLADGAGWRQVDPTAGMGCHSGYVPLMASENGAIPLVYTSAVRIVPKPSTN